MKYSYPLMLAFLLLTAPLNSKADNNDWGGINRYASDNATLPVTQKGEHRVVFLGNSITDAWINYHPDFFSANNYIDRGISGQTSSQFLVRFREDVINLHPEVVVINAGTNDCAENTGPFNLDITFGNIVSMVELANANDIKVVLASVLPASGFSWNRSVTDAADRIAALNNKIREYARKNNIPYVDYYSSMVYGPDRALNPAYTNDGVHPTAEGYSIMEAIVKPVVDKVIKKK